ncbi:DUF6093 family protein [Quadrisphaera sp. GCM10027208]|uniref:DUF6093 family protein n=1 Tax=Quadrisphaera sp. GCM10027208 TaxID=3273423 RepID=UPI00360E847D
MRPNVELLRSRQASYLTETGTVTRPGGEGYWDDTLGQWVEGGTVLVHDGPLLVRPQSNAERVVEAGEATVAVSKYDVTLPALTPVQRGDTVTVTSSPLDPALEGVQLTVQDVPLDVWQVARYCVAVMVT